MNDRVLVKRLFVPLLVAFSCDIPGGIDMTAFPQFVTMKSPFVNCMLTEEDIIRDAPAR